MPRSLRRRSSSDRAFRARGSDMMERHAPIAGRTPMRAVAGVAALLLVVLAALAATYPPLTGRIVDQANIIPAETRNAIEPKLADLEQKSGIQLVVATVRSLDARTSSLTPMNCSAPGG